MSAIAEWVFMVGQLEIAEQVRPDPGLQSGCVLTRPHGEIAEWVKFTEEWVKHGRHVHPLCSCLWGSWSFYDRPLTLHITPDNIPRHSGRPTRVLRGYIGQRGISLSGSYQQGYSTTYNTQLHIKVVCNGYILTHISNCNSRGYREALPPKEKPHLV
jgi:hypothetical protein